jgi:hypothetical protein
VGGLSRAGSGRVSWSGVLDGWNADMGVVDRVVGWLVPRRGVWGTLVGCVVGGAAHCWVLRERAFPLAVAVAAAAVGVVVVGGGGGCLSGL